MYKMLTSESLEVQTRVIFIVILRINQLEIGHKLQLQ